MSQDLKALCKALRLAYVADVFEEVSFRDKEQFLYDVLAKELQQRQEAKVARLIKRAKFRELKWLKDYEWTNIIHLPASTTKEAIYDLKFLEHRQNLLLLGSSGTGKTHLATALGVKACEQGKEVRFFRVADLVSQLEEGFHQGTLQRIKRSVERCDLLILDELGCAP